MFKTNHRVSVLCEASAMQAPFLSKRYLGLSNFQSHALKWLLLTALSAALPLPAATAQKKDLMPGRWEKAIQAFEAADKASPPPKDAILLVGGSNARRWTNVADYFPGMKVINRGFGGAQLADVVHFADRIIIPYAPKTVFLNAGGNDLSSGKTPEQVRDACKALVARVSAALPQTRIYYITIPPVLRAAKVADGLAIIRRTNGLVEELARADSRLGFIDLFSRFLDDKGQPKPGLFVSDGTHFSPQGYEIAAALMREKAGARN